MKLEGSCHCGSVRIRVTTHTPYPYMRCYCSICRKTAGGGGYAINIMGDAASLKVRGMPSVGIYRAWLRDATSGRRKRSPARRHFCVKCASALWLADPQWPEWVYPFASAIDTPLPSSPGGVEMMLDYAVGWADVPQGRDHTHFGQYPAESIIDWHRRRGLAVD
ncbi:MAG: GFA family protein [Betaproteobacteria bacterium]